MSYDFYSDALLVWFKTVSNPFCLLYLVDCEAKVDYDSIGDQFLILKLGSLISYGLNSPLSSVVFVLTKYDEIPVSVFLNLPCSWAHFHVLEYKHGFEGYMNSLFRYAMNGVILLPAQAFSFRTIRLLLA